MKKLSLLPSFALITTLAVSSCSQKASAPQTSLGIQTPLISGSSAITPAVVASSPYVNSGLWGLATPTTLAEIDCYAIAVSYSEETNNSCHLLDGGAIDLDEMFGPVKAGELLNGDISSGKSRNIQVIGFATSDGECPSDVTKLTKTQMAQSSAPVILGSSITDVEGDEMDVDILISMDNPVAINDCAGELYSWEEGEVTPSNFSVDSGYLTVVGANLGSVHKATMKDASGNTTELSVESRNNNGLALKAFSALNLAMNSVYELIVSNAYGQTVFPISVGGSSGYNVVNIASDTTVSNTQSQSLFLVNGSHTVNLPAAADAGAGFNIIIKSIGTGFDGTVVVATSGGELVDSSSTHLILNSHLATINLTSDGTNWWMLSSNGTIETTNSIPTCTSVTCYSDSAFESVTWARHSPSGKLIRRYSCSGCSESEPWRTLYISADNGATYQERYLINNHVNTTNSSYTWTNNWDVAVKFDQKLFHNISGNSWAGPIDVNGGGTNSIESSFNDSNISTNHADNTTGTPEDGFLNTVISNFSSGFYPLWGCHNNGGRMLSTADGLASLPEVGVTYWSADYASYDGTLSDPYYKTLTYDGSTMTEGSSEWGQYYTIMCVWDDVTTAFGLE